MKRDGRWSEIVNMDTEKSSEHEKKIEDRQQGLNEDGVELTDLYDWIGKSFKKLLAWSKDYLTTCILLISGLGAILQIYNLILIDITYVRFFSPSQLIADGSLILAITIILFVSYKIAGHLTLNDDMRQAIKKHSREDKGYLKRCIYAAIPIAGLLLFLVIIKILTKPGYIIYGIASIGFIIAALEASILHASEYSSYIAEKEDATKKELFLSSMTEIWQLGLGILTIMLYMMLVIIVGSISYKVPEDLENINKVVDRVKQDYVDVKKYEVLYFNDKYLFIRLNKENSATTVIYNTNEVIFDNNVIINQPKK